MKKILKFEKENCNPCSMVSDFLDKKGIKYEKVNPYNNPEIALKYKIRTVPTVIVLENEKEIMRTIGFKIEELKKLEFF